jgi:hypothetical protein
MNLYISPFLIYLNQVDSLYCFISKITNKRNFKREKESIMNKTFDQQYNGGFPIFCKLFEMNKKDLSETLKSICSIIVKEFDFNNAEIHKTIVNDIPHMDRMLFLFNRFHISFWNKLST